MLYLYIGELFKMVQMNKYITYADIYRLIVDNEAQLPAFYEHWGWTNVSECHVNTGNGYQDIKLILTNHLVGIIPSMTYYLLVITIKIKKH